MEYLIHSDVVGGEPKSGRFARGLYIYIYIKKSFFADSCPLLSRPSDYNDSPSLLDVKKKKFQGDLGYSNTRTV